MSSCIVVGNRRAPRTRWTRRRMVRDMDTDTPMIRGMGRVTNIARILGTHHGVHHHTAHHHHSGHVYSHDHHYRSDSHHAHHQHSDSQHRNSDHHSSGVTGTTAVASGPAVAGSSQANVASGTATRDPSKTPEFDNEKLRPPSRSSVGTRRTNRSRTTVSSFLSFSSLFRKAPKLWKRFRGKNRDIPSIVESARNMATSSSTCRSWIPDSNSDWTTFSTQHFTNFHPIRMGVAFPLEKRQPYICTYVLSPSSLRYAAKLGYSLLSGYHSP